MTLDTTTGREEVLAELRSGDKFLLTTHENPDGDALGSLVAMNEILRALGKDTVMFLSEEEFPLPYEYRWLPLDGACHTLPADAEERTIVFLDCGNVDRMPVSFLGRDDAHIVNIDHHHDNTRFGTANLVVDGASSTAEIIWDLNKDLGVELTHRDRRGAVRRARDRHRQVPVREHDADVARDGRRPARPRRRGARDLPPAVRERAARRSCELLARVLSRVERYDDGRLTVSYILRSDYEETGADENYSEGIVDHIRALEGTVVAALVREQLKEGRDGVHEGEPAGLRGRGRRERDRARGGRRRSPPGRRLLHRRAPARS